MVSALFSGGVLKCFFLLLHFFFSLHSYLLFLPSYLLNIAPHCLGQTVLKLSILLPQLPECSDYRHVLPQQAQVLSEKCLEPMGLLVVKELPPKSHLVM